MFVDSKEKLNNINKTIRVKMYHYNKFFLRLTWRFFYELTKTRQVTHKKINRIVCIFSILLLLWHFFYSVSAWKNLWRWRILFDEKFSFIYRGFISFTLISFIKIVYCVIVQEFNVSDWAKNFVTWTEPMFIIKIFFMSNWIV